MKLYELLKDLPTFSAGDAFYLDSNNNLRQKWSDIMAYNHHTLEKFPNILKDWFEEIPEEPKEWRREEKTGDYIKYLIAREILLDDARGGKWKKNGINICMYYDHSTNEWAFDSTVNDMHTIGVIYFQNEEDAQKSLDDHKKQWEIVRKYGMGEK